MDWTAARHNKHGQDGLWLSRSTWGLMHLAPHSARCRRAQQSHNKWLSRRSQCYSIMVFFPQAATCSHMQRHDEAKQDFLASLGHTALA